MKTKLQMGKMLSLLALALLWAAAAWGEELEYPLGTWYGYDLHGQPYNFTILENGKCSMVKEGTKGSKSGKWTQDGPLLTLQFQSRKYYFTMEEDQLIYSDINSIFAFDDAVFTREPYESYEIPAVNQEATQEDFQGKWRMIWINNDTSLYAIPTTLIRWM